MTQHSHIHIIPNKHEICFDEPRNNLFAAEGKQLIEQIFLFYWSYVRNPEANVMDLDISVRSAVSHAHFVVTIRNAIVISPYKN